jgi:predicted Fe-Mo cluster-binding NifX family protein
MIIAFPVESDEGLDSEISMHFGRARYFAFVKVEEKRIVDFSIKLNSHIEHEAGDLPKFIKENGADTIVAYGMGPRAVDFFNKYGINVISGAKGKIRDVTEAILKDSLMVDELWKEHGDFEHREKD